MALWALCGYVMESQSIGRPSIPHLWNKAAILTLAHVVDVILDEIDVIRRRGGE